MGKNSRRGRVERKSVADVGVEGIDVHCDDTAEYGVREVSRAEGVRQVFGGENRLEIVRIYAGVAVTFLFKIDTPTSCEGIRFGAQTSGAEADDHVEGVQELRPPGLSSGEEFGGGEVL